MRNFTSNIKALHVLNVAGYRDIAEVAEKLVRAMSRNPDYHPGTVVIEEATAWMRCCHEEFLGGIPAAANSSLTLQCEWTPSELTSLREATEFISGVALSDMFNHSFIYVNMNEGHTVLLMNSNLLE